MKEKNQVIVVTDGDKTAREALEKASGDMNVEVISSSSGTPTPYSGEELIEEINKCPVDPVVIMFDDNGDLEEGTGERALKTVLVSPKIEVLGVLAVASNAKKVRGITPDFSVTRDKEVIAEPVTKEGLPESKGHQVLEGDTVDVLSEFSDLLIVGIGDIGKMEGKDDPEVNAPITSKALQEVFKRSVGLNEN